MLTTIAENNKKLSQSRLNSYDSYEAIIQKSFAADAITSIISVLCRGEGEDEGEIIICDFIVTKFCIFIFQKAHDNLLHSFHMLLIKSISFNDGLVNMFSSSSYFII